METKVVTAHLPSELAAKVDAIAARHNRSRGWIIKQALSAWVEQEERGYRMTLEALADVDAGRTVDHHDVETWVDGLDSTVKPSAQPSADPAFGIWRDREDMTDIEAYLRKLSAPRCRRDGTRNDG